MRSGLIVPAAICVSGSSSFIDTPGRSPISGPRPATGIADPAPVSRRCPARCSGLPERIIAQTKNPGTHPATSEDVDLPNAGFGGPVTKLA